MFHKIHYFKKSDNICAEDLKEKEKIEIINISLISSISDLLDFKLPFSGKFIGKYALITMNNGDKFYVNEKPYLFMMELLGPMNPYL
jgi:hypothetical protein